MASEALEEKVRFFGQLESIGGASGSDVEDAGKDEAEKQHREKCRAFFESYRKDRGPPRSRSRSSDSGNRQLSSPARRAPAVIEGTPVPGRGGQSKKHRTTSLSFVEDTPVPDTARAARPTLGRSSTHLADEPRRSRNPEDSPLVGSTMGKRKRSNPAPAAKPVPETDRVFRGLAFYYIPNNDIAPARKLRIGRARDYGALWVRDVDGATHAVVDKNLAYGDVEKILSPAPASLVVVNEDYPIDSISFRTLLNPHQPRYRVTGCPVAAQPRASSPAEAGPITDHDGSDTSKLPRREGPETLVSDVPAQEGTIDDELSEYISLVRQYEHLPLDEDEDRPSSSEGTGGPGSGSGSGPGSHPVRSRQLRRGSTATGKSAAYEEQFACHRGGTKDTGGASGNPNARTIEVLQSMCDYYTRVDDQWRTMAYRKAISTLGRQTVKISTEEEAYRLPTIGRRLAQKIEEIARTDRLRRLEHARDEPSDAVLQTFLGIYDVGASRARRWIAQGLRTLEDLRARADLTPNQRLGIDHYDDLNARIPRAEVAALAAHVRAAAAEVDPRVELLVGGSYRRGAESSGDVDVIFTRAGTASPADLVPFLEALVALLTRRGFLVATLASLLHGRRPGSGDGSGSGSKSSSNKWHGCCVLPGAEPPVWRRIDLLLVPEAQYGAALIYFTGNDIFNRSMRLLASRRGMRLNHRGLYKDVMRGPGRAKVTEGELVEGRDEKRIFELLGVRWREPWERWC